MKSPPFLAFIVLTLSLLLGGCWNMQASDPYVPVQDYTGQGYRLMNGDRMDKIAEAHRKEIIDATKTFFLDQYKTKVNVHNIVGNKDGATVFVESIGEPHFHTYAIVPIDARNDYVMKHEVWSQEGQVEDAIMGSVFALTFGKEISKLNHYLDHFVQTYPVIGVTKEAIDNAFATGYTTPYMYLTINDDVFNILLKEYLKNPKLDIDNLRKEFNRHSYEPEGITITIHLYMKKADVEPDKKIFHQLISDIKNMEGIPRGTYSIMLDDNRIDKEHAIGMKDNTLDTDPNNIIKK